MDRGLRSAEGALGERSGVRANVASLPCPDAEDIAGVLGLIPMSTQASSEYRRHHAIVELMMPRLQMEPWPYQRRVMARFCAFYLPTLLDSVFDLPPPTYEDPDDTDDDEHHGGYFLGNAFAFMLHSIVKEPYFIKFLASSHPVAVTRVRQLPAFYARQLIELFELFTIELRTVNARRFQENARVQTRRFVTNFFNILVNIGIHTRPADCAVPDSVKSALLPYLTDWPRRFPNVEEPGYDEMYQAVSLLLRGKPLRGSLERLEDHAVQRFSKCAKNDCAIKHDLYICGRCGTEVYCSREHQRSRWTDPEAPHKDLCFQTVY